MSRVLVIGGTRFVGLGVIRALLEGGWEVSALHRGQSPLPYPLDVNEILCDRRDREGIARAISAGCEAVVDLCAFEPDDLVPLLSLLPGLTGRYLLLSTVSVYADRGLFPVREGHPLFDGDPARTAAAAYSAGKVACEREVRALDLPWTILRPAFIYGPWNTFYREAYYFDLIEQGRAVTVGSTGTYLTQLGFVSDLGRAVAACLDLPCTAGKAYNVTGPACTQRALLDTIVGTLRPGRQAEEGPAEYAPWGLKRHVCACSCSLTADTGWAPQVNLSEGLALTYEWYLAHGNQRRQAWENHAFRTWSSR